MEGNEIENLAIRIKQQIAEKIEDYASIQSEPLRKEIERLNAELVQLKLFVDELEELRLYKHACNESIAHLDRELTLANAKVEELSQWKETQIKLWLPVIEFMQENANMKWGGGISEEVLKRLKETNDLYSKANGQ